MAINTYLLTIYWNANCLNGPIKSYMVAEWRTKQDPTYTVCKGLSSDQKTHTDWQ